MKDQVSHPYNTRGKVIVLYILVFRSLDRRQEDGCEHSINSHAFLLRSNVAVKEINKPMMWPNVKCGSEMFNLELYQYTLLQISAIKLAGSDTVTLPQHFCEVLHRRVRFL
jgi:hypothetical protein